MEYEHSHASTGSHATMSTMLREARRQQGLSKSAASRKIGVSRATYDLWERGAVIPAMDYLKTLESFTGSSKAEVLCVLARANGYIDESAHLEIHHGS